MKVITSFHTLMKYARALGEAELSGDQERIKIAKANHDNYKQACLEADEMSIGMTRGDINSIGKE